MIPFFVHTSPHSLITAHHQSMRLEHTVSTRHLLSFREDPLLIGELL
jgi:hypothetical protein